MCKIHQIISDYVQQLLISLIRKLLLILEKILKFLVMFNFLSQIYKIAAMLNIYNNSKFLITFNKLSHILEFMEMQTINISKSLILKIRKKIYLFLKCFILKKIQ